ncbi:MAG TPA: hypothetical protein VGL53_06325 [Bryobacteraceae bacterium]|jgi:hypothetical protein
MAQAKPLPDMKDTLLDIDWKARRFRVGRCGAVVIIAIVLGVAGKLKWGIPLAIPPAIVKLLEQGK